MRFGGAVLIQTIIDGSSFDVINSPSFHRIKTHYFDIFKTTKQKVLLEKTALYINQISHFFLSQSMWAYLENANIAVNTGKIKRL